MKIGDVRIGQDVFYINRDALPVVSFIVKGIMQGYDEDEWVS